MKKLIFLLLSVAAFAQNPSPQPNGVRVPRLVDYGNGIAVSNSISATANASALLDVQSTTKGILIPRMTMTQRDAIAIPATGLMVYQTDNIPGFRYWDGSSWVFVTGDLQSVLNQGNMADGNIILDDGAGNLFTAGAGNISLDSPSNISVYQADGIQISEISSNDYFQANFDTMSWIRTSNGSGIVLRPNASITGAGNRIFELPDKPAGTYQLATTADAGGVQSVTGTTIDNTDPENPVVNVPSLAQVTAVGASTTTNISVTNGTSTANLTADNIYTQNTSGQYVNILPTGIVQSTNTGSKGLLRKNDNMTFSYTVQAPNFPSTGTRYEVFSSSELTADEPSYLSGVTSSIQTQLNSKQSSTVSNTGHKILTNTTVQEQLDQADTAIFNVRSTGVTSISGAITSPTSTTVNIPALTGGIVNVSTGIYYPITYAGATGLTPTITNGTTYYYIDSSGALQQTGTVLTEAQKRTNIEVGYSASVSGTVTLVATTANPTSQDANSLHQLSRVLGQIRIDGVVLSAPSANLNIAVSSGSFFLKGAAAATSANDPDTDISAAYSSATTQMRNYTTAGLVSSTNDLDVGFYQLAGVRTAIPNPASNYSNFYIFRGRSGVIYSVYSRNYYTTAASALASLTQAEAYASLPAAFTRASVFCIGAITVKKGATNLQAADVYFTQTDVFGGFAGAVGTASGAFVQSSTTTSTDNRIARYDGTDGKTIQESPVAITDSGEIIMPGVASPTYTAGKLVYDTSNESLTFYNNDANVSLQVGQELWIPVRNVSGSTIANGAAVYISGTNSGLPTIALAQANSASTTVVAGLATESIANNSNGYVTAIGTVRGLNTSSFSAGNIFLSATTPGALTQTVPTAPNYRYRVGFVTNVNASTGTIHVTPSTAALGNGTYGQALYINSSGNQEFRAPSSYMVLSSPYTLTNTTSVQKLFNVGTSGNGAFQAKANTTYHFLVEAGLNSLSSSSSTFSFALGGTATITSMNAFANAVKAADTPTTTQSTKITSTASTVITGASANPNGRMLVEGYFRVTTAGTVIPSIAMSIGAAGVVEANSSARFTEVGANTFTASPDID